MIEATIEDWQIIVQGFKEARIENIPLFFEMCRRLVEDCEIQFFNADMIAGFDHLFFAALNAIKAFNSGLNISNSLAVEILLYASGRNQIKEAIELIGIKRDSTKIVCLIITRDREKSLESLKTISDMLDAELADEVLELTEIKNKNIKASYEISDVEIKATNTDSETEAIQNLVIERVALLMTYR